MVVDGEAWQLWLTIGTFSLQLISFDRWQSSLVNLGAGWNHVGCHGQRLILKNHEFKHQNHWTVWPFCCGESFNLLPASWQWDCLLRQGPSESTYMRFVLCPSLPAMIIMMIHFNRGYYMLSFLNVLCCHHQPDSVLVSFLLCQPPKGWELRSRLLWMLTVSMPTKSPYLDVYTHLETWLIANDDLGVVSHLVGFSTMG